MSAGAATDRRFLAPARRPSRTVLSALRHRHRPDSATVQGASGARCGHASRRTPCRRPPRHAHPLSWSPPRAPGRRLVVLARLPAMVTAPAATPVVTGNSPAGLFTPPFRRDESVTTAAVTPKPRTDVAPLRRADRRGYLVLLDPTTWGEGLPAGTGLILTMPPLRHPFAHGPALSLSAHRRRSPDPRPVGTVAPAPCSRCRGRLMPAAAMPFATLTRGRRVMGQARPSPRPTSTSSADDAAGRCGPPSGGRFRPSTGPGPAGGGRRAHGWCSGPVLGHYDRLGVRARPNPAVTLFIRLDRRPTRLVQYDKDMTDIGPVHHRGCPAASCDGGAGAEATGRPGPLPPGNRPGNPALHEGKT